MRFTLIVLLQMTMIGFSTANPIEFSSKSQATNVIQLFTSEGCSSCPPADQWLSELKDKPGLFSDFIPLVFHVDYWDWLGWEDRFASPKNTQRQRALARSRILSQVYTPGFVINDQEFRQFFRGQRTWKSNQNEPGVLHAALNGTSLKVTFEQDRSMDLHLAWLGMGLSNQVSRGENRGKTLHHDFVVLEHAKIKGKSEWNLTLKAAPDKGQQQLALVVWVSPVEQLEIVQATGGFVTE